MYVYFEHETISHIKILYSLRDVLWSIPESENMDWGVYCKVADAESDFEASPKQVQEMQRRLTWEQKLLQWKRLWAGPAALWSGACQFGLIALNYPKLACFPALILSQPPPKENLAQQCYFRAKLGRTMRIQVSLSGNKWANHLESSVYSCFSL